jgi:hypothetical protein
MPTELRITQIKGIPEPAAADVNKALVYKGSGAFDFESLNTSELATLQGQVTSLDTRVDALEAAAITSVDGGEY